LYSGDLERDKLLVEAELHRILAKEGASFGQLVSECMSYSVFSKGKRLRPLLGFQVARALDANPVACLTHLAAVEILHTASLVIDDMPCMDNAAVRRSMPSAHLRYGESIALLAALALLTLSIRLAETESPATKSSSVGDFKTMLLNSFGRGGLIAGQELDLTHKDFVPARYSKTTPLFELACAAGLVCADLCESERSRIIGFGRSYGRAFQEMDDFVDSGNHRAGSAARELAKCHDHLAELENHYHGFNRLRELVSYLDAKQSVGF
jgi:geranylgeranyl diphosphate synthase type II